MNEAPLMKTLPLFLVVALTAGTPLGCGCSSVELRDAQADGQSQTGGGGSGSGCLDGNGNVLATVKACVASSDCTTGTIPTCCGSDLAVGLAKTASCVFPVPDCSGLGCAKMLYPRTDDGDTADANSVVRVRCLAGLCTSFVNHPPSTGGAGGGPGGSGGA